MRRHTLLSTLLALAFAIPAFGQSPAPAATGTTWEIDQNHTSASFAVRHMMVTNVRGTFGKVAGTIQYDGKDVPSIAANVTIDVASIDTNNEKRDAHLRSADFFDAATHPTITFRSKRVDKVAAGRFKLIGDLTIRGVTKEAVLDVEGPTAPVTAMGATKIGATATTTINRQDYGVKWNRNIDAGGVVVGDEVRITLEIEANKKAATAPTAQ